MLPRARVAPVFTRLILVDRSFVIVAGARTSLGESTVWVTDDAEVLALANDLWDRTYAVSSPVIPDGRPPPLSPRTVVADIRAVCAHLGAGNRTEMVAKLLKPFF
jgi:hypothetical protein